MNKDAHDDVENYYNKALQFTKSHYENFPVISLFVKRDIRKHIAIIYQFARQADDIADEGVMPQDERITQLNNYESELERSFSNNFSGGFWKALKLTIDQYKLDIENFFNLLKAFKQDVWKKRYKNFSEVLQYCKYSANPIGRLILGLYNIHNPDAQKYSDKICTALQLTNFYQDVSVDIFKNRIYLPEDELANFKVGFDVIKQKQFSEQFKNLMKFQVDRTKTMFDEGINLLSYLPIRLRFQILVTIKGGQAILKKIEIQNYNVLENRPTLSKIDFIRLFLTALLFGK
jgi:squalene synthase HpnC